MSSHVTRRQALTAAMVGGAAVGGAVIKAVWPTKSAPAAGSGWGEPQGSPNTEPRTTPIRSTPRDLTPHTDMAGLVPLDSLRKLLARLTPSWYPLKTGKVMHAFRLWGPKAEFPADIFTHPYPDPPLSGQDLMGYLLDESVYRRYAPGSSPLLSKTPSGIKIRVERDKFHGTYPGSPGHLDDILAACGELNLPADTPVRPPGCEGTLADVVRHSAAEFSSDHELEWTVEAFVRYLDETDRWINRVGRVTTFDDVARELTARPLGRGPCLGTHNLYALACLYRANMQEQILSPPVRDGLKRRFEEASLGVTASRQGAGWWAARWAPGTDLGQSPLPATTEELLAVVSTGHHFEWMALVPPDFRPPLAVVKLAVGGVFDWLAGRTVDERDQAYRDLTHLARALCVMLGRDPSDIVRDRQRLNGLAPASPVQKVP
jgi:hypothetical protein